MRQAIAIGFARADARVVVTSRKISDLEATAEQIKSFGGEAFPVQAHLGLCQRAGTLQHPG